MDQVHVIRHKVLVEGRSQRRGRQGVRDFAADGAEIRRRGGAGSEGSGPAGAAGVGEGGRRGCRRCSPTRRSGPAASSG